MRVVAAGEALLAPNVTRRLIEEFAHRPEPRSSAAIDLESLTDRELEVLTLVARGMSNAEIAEELFMWQATAKTHVSRLLTKLDARDRAQLVVARLRIGFGGPRLGLTAAGTMPAARRGAREAEWGALLRR